MRLETARERGNRQGFLNTKGRRWWKGSKNARQEGNQTLLKEQQEKAWCHLLSFPKSHRPGWSKDKGGFPVPRQRAPRSLDTSKSSHWIPNSLGPEVPTTSISEGENCWMCLGTHRKAEPESSPESDKKPIHPTILPLRYTLGMEILSKAPVLQSIVQ